MTEDLGWVGLEVRPDVNSSTLGSQLGRGLNGPLDAAGRSGGKRLGSILGKTAVGVAGGVIAAGYAAISIGKDAYAEAKEARKVAALTEQTIKSTGRAANISAKEVGKLSESIMRKTAIDDEQIQSGANILLTFKKIRNEVGAGNKIFNLATKAAVDLGSTDFTTLEGGAKMLGKALNDPAAGLTALKKAGVDFTAEQKKRIEGFVAENNILGAQKIILGEVRSQVGGAAAAQADAGDKLRVTIGNIKEDIGTVLMPEIDRFADWLSDKGPAAGRKFSGWLRDDAIPAVKRFVDKTRPLAEELIPALGDALGIAKDVLSEALPLAKDFVGAFNDMPDWAKKAIVGGALAGGLASKFNLLPSKGGGGAAGLLGSMKPVPVFVTNKGFGTPDVPGKPGAGKTPWLAALGLPGIAGLGGFAAMAATNPGDRNAAAPGSGGYAGDGGLSLPPSVSNTEGLDDATEGFRDFVKGTLLGQKGADDFGAAMENTIPLAELLGGEVTRTGRSVGLLSERFKALPDGVETAIKTPGLIQSRADVMDLKRKYDLTPREVKTVLRSLGFIEARNQAADVKRAMDLLRDKTITITTLRRTVGTGVGPAYNGADDASGGGGGGTVNPRLNANGPVPIVINLPNGAPLDGYMDDRIHANERLKGQRR